MENRRNTGGLYGPLSDDQVKTIHKASLTILEDTGISFEPRQEELLELLEKAGAKIDQKGSRIRFEKDLVMEAVSEAPGRVVLYSRDGKNDLELEGDQVHFGTGGTTTTVLDPDTGECRPSTLEDVYHLARLTDHLDNIDLFIRPFTPLDIPEDTYDVNICYAGLKGTSKHVMMGIFDESRFSDVVDIVAMIAGGIENLREKPFISFYTSFSISPLQQTNKSTRILCEAITNRIPISIGAGVMAGLTGPITMAGTLTLTHAEVIAGITISQLLSPGAPVLYGGLPVRADMATADVLFGTIECAMMNAAIHQLAKYIKVPNCSSCGFSESKIPDAQAGWECAMLILTAAMGGSNLIRHAGGGVLDSAMTVAYEQIVMNDEIIGMARRLLRGIEVSDEHIGLELINNLGPGGSFLTTEHTLKFMRSEYFYGSGITNRDQREKWIKDGSKDARLRARNIVKKILSGTEKSHIPDAVDHAIREKYQIYL